MQRREAKKGGAKKRKKTLWEISRRHAGTGENGVPQDHDYIGKEHWFSRCRPGLSRETAMKQIEKRKTLMDSITLHNIP